MTAVKELLVCKAKVPAGDDPGTLHLDRIVSVVLKTLREEVTGRECVECGGVCGGTGAL